MDNLTLIEKLANARGASGFEDEVLLIAREYCKDFASFEEDSMRNLYIRPSYNKGNRPLVMLDAHSDEVGFMVQAIKPDGTLRFIPIGGWNEKSLPSSKVQVYTEKGYIAGVIAAMPPHLMTAEQRNAPLTYANLTIDIGATSDKEAADLGVEVGAPVVPLSPFDCDGRHGITAVMGRIKPQAAICFEGCPADDTSAPSYMIQDAIRGGVMLRHMDATVICTPRFTAFSRKVAKEAGIKVQTAVRSGGGNNGAYIISANGGTPVIVAGIPVRYIHTFNCIAAMEDVESNISFGVELCKSLTEDIIKGF